MPPTFGNGKICYMVIPAQDVDRSAAFYAEAFGWSVRKRDDGSTSFDDGVGEVSGTWVLGRKAHTNDGLLVHIMVDDAEAAVAKVVALGGLVLQPIDPNAKEIVAHFTDPAGNVMGIYQHGGRK